MPTGIASRFACCDFIAASRVSHCVVTSAHPVGVRRIGPITASDAGLCAAASATFATVISNTDVVSSVNFRMIDPPVGSSEGYFKAYRLPSVLPTYSTPPSTAGDPMIAPTEMNR